jgi:hypothetical protein
MYGVPADLDLSHFQGGTCVQIAIGEHQIQFHFHPEARIYVDGRWELRDGQGQVVDQSVEHGERDTYQVHRILGQSVVDSSVSSPTSFSLTFANGHVLEVFDDSTHYESCQLSPSGVII